MIGGSYLVFGFALFSFLLRRGHQKEGREILEFYAELSLAFTLLVVIDLFFSTFLWDLSERNDYRLVSCFLWAFLFDQLRIRLKGKRTGRIRERFSAPFFVGPFFLVLMGFSLWAIENDSFQWGLGFIAATGIVEWFLEGLRSRLQLANVPKALEGGPILFWSAMQIFLAFWGFYEVFSRL